MPLANQNPLTVLGTPPDPAGWPNGRRPIDDVTDVAIRVVGGTNYLTAGDNVDANDRPLLDRFPFLPTPWDGFSRIHQNPPTGPDTPTPTITATGTPFTSTPTGTLTVTLPPSVTPTPTGTFVVPTVPSVTPTGTFSPTPSLTSTLTPSATPSQTNTSTSTPALPDLTITTMKVELENPVCLSPGNALGLRVFVTNSGQAAAGTFVVAVNGMTQTVTGLAAGATEAVFFATFVPMFNPVTATVDSTGTVTESNETNNTRTEIVPIPTPPLPCTPTPTSTPTTPSP